MLDPFFTSSYKRKLNVSPEAQKECDRLMSLPERRDLYFQLRARTKSGERIPDGEYTFVVQYSLREKLLKRRGIAKHKSPLVNLAFGGLNTIRA